MPIRLVWSLNTGRREKMGVTIMFILGGFVAVVSIVRFVILATGNLKVGDVTWNTVEFHIWTTVEPTIAVVCACLPTLKPIFFWGKARVKGSTDASASKSFSKSRSGSFSKNTWPESFSHNSDTDATSLSALEQGRAPREQPWEASMLGNSKVRGHFKNKATSAAVPVGPEETGQEQELPLGLIEVRKDVDWSENKPANR
ncbi:MAG: hypothetical protein M1837_003765 [Sclerophora amabilis]|nr:MAG: hypothetical protein M1837_003765 [Sclerophora amabilis]